MFYSMFYHIRYTTIKTCRYYLKYSVFIRYINDYFDILVLVVRNLFRMTVLPYLTYVSRTNRHRNYKVKKFFIKSFILLLLSFHFFTILSHVILEQNRPTNLYQPKVTFHYVTHSKLPQSPLYLITIIRSD